MKKQLDNSVADVIENPTKCPQCGAITQLDHGTCINCLLREGLGAKGESSREAFESILSEANVTDTQWRLGHYEILEEIGRGGMGVIYRARQQHSRRIVAVKRVLAHDVNSHETLVRFRREAEAVARLDHPNILPIYEVSESEEGLPFFSMKYATGGSLRAAAPALRSKPRECVRLMAKVARAIAYAHGKGVLHRDLQPGNILLDENGEPMVSDFGLAKWLDQNSDLTRTLETLGTPGYIAPEQAESRAADLTSAADIYSLGAILFYLLTGRPPFVGPNVLCVIHQAAATPAPRLRLLVPSLDRDLETIVGHCLEPDPNARYQSAGALGEDLEHWLRREPIRARRTGVVTRGQKWVRRNPSTAVFAALLVALGVSLGVMIWNREPGIPVPKSVAVLPFENLSGDPDNAYFTDGVQDEILTDMARIADLKVIGRTSVMQYKSGVARDLRKIGQQLGAAHLVEGSVQRSGNRVRVNAQLVYARSNRRLWGHTYDGDLADFFGIQSRIAMAIANELHAKLSPNEKSEIERPATNDITAFDLYTRARKLVLTPSFGVSEKPNLLQAVDLLNQSVARDPSFFRGYCQLAFVHDALYFFGQDQTSARLALAETALQAASRLRPDAGETYLARAWNLYWGHLDYNGALAELEVARHTLPNDPQILFLTGIIQRRQGHWEESIRTLERAADLDPRNFGVLQNVAGNYATLGRYAEQQLWLGRVLAFEPNDAVTKVILATVDFEWRADTQPLHRMIDSIRTTNPAAVPRIAEWWLHCALAERDTAAAKDALIGAGENPINLGNDVFCNRPFVEGVIARMAKDDDKARSAFTAARADQEEIVQAQPNFGPPWCVLGLIDAALGRKEEALREGRHAVELLPVEKDAVRGPAVIKYLAMIAAWAGDKDLACQQLAIIVRPPSPVTYGQLKLLPFWDSLRGDPRFEQIVASLAPK